MHCQEQSFSVPKHLNTVNEERCEVECVLNCNECDLVEKTKCESQVYMGIRDAFRLVFEYGYVLKKER